MSSASTPFNNIVETIYNMPLEDRIELKSLLEHNIADSRREETALSYKEAQEEHKARKLTFSDDTDELLKIL